MTNKVKTTYAVSLITALALAIAAIVLRTYVILTSFDEATANFDYSPIYNAYLILIAVSVLLVVIPLILLRSMNEVRVLRNDIPTLFSSAFCVIALAVYAIYSVIQVATGAYTGLSLAFSLISAACAIASCPYFVCTLAGARASDSTLSVFATLNVLFGCMLAFFLYTDNTLFITSPVKILHIASAMMIAFFFIGEARIALNRAIWSFYVCVSLIALIITSSDAVSCLIYVPVKSSEGIGASAHCFLILAFSLYIFSRLVAIYLVNCKDARGLLAVFEASSRRAHAHDGEDLAEQLHMNLEGSGDVQENEEN